jgi:hypothetical protein
MKKHLSEDSTMYNVNRQQYGITARKDSKGDTDPQANTVSGLLKSNKKDSNYEASKVKPYPLGMVDDVISDLYLSSSNLRHLILNARENPELKDEYKSILEWANKRLILIDKAIVEISQKLDKIS